MENEYMKTIKSNIEEQNKSLSNCIIQSKRGNIDYNSEQVFYAIKYLLTINSNNITKDSAVFLIKALAERKKSKIINSNQASLNIVVETDPVKYKREHKKNPIAVCRSEGPNKYTIIYSPRVIDYITSPHNACKLYGLAAICHELKHVNQLLTIENDTVNGIKTDRTYQEYILALENMAYNIDGDFYKDNYYSFFIEQQAIRTGYDEAINVIREFAQEEFLNYLMEYQSDALQGEDELESYVKEKIYKQRNLIENNFKLDDPIKVGKKSFSQENRIKIVEQLAQMYIKMDPDIIEEYPVLKLAFNSDGSRKSIGQLFQDRHEMLLSSRINKSEIDDLYRVIIEERFYENPNREIIQLQGIMKNCSQNEINFCEELINSIKQQLNPKKRAIRDAVKLSIQQKILLKAPIFAMKLAYRKRNRKLKKGIINPNYGSEENR